jgi:hypothetical protein
METGQLTVTSFLEPVIELVLDGEQETRSQDPEP